MFTPRNYQYILKQFQWKYAIALLVIALLSLCCQIHIQNYLNNQYSDSHLINYAAKLRADSQTMVKYALLLQEGKNYRTDGKDFTNTFKQWTATHKSLRHGNDFLNIPPNADKMIEELFTIIDTPYQNMLDAGNEICNILESRNVKDTIMLKPYVQQLLNYEKSYLLGMEMIVFEYDLTSKQNIRHLKQVEWWLFALLIICLILEALFIFVPLYHQLRNTFQNLMESNRASHEMASRLQKIRSDAILTGETRERKRISSEIHDGIGQMLTALKMRIEMLENQEELKGEMLADIREMTVTIVKETRRVCAELLPNILDDFGLKSAINELQKTVRENSKLDVSFHDEIEEGVLTKQQEVIIYRILQEAINNAMKHAHASHLEINTETDAENIYITIKDDGIGFKVKIDEIYDGQSSGIHGLGLLNMKERTEMMGGKFHILSVPGKGTTISLTIPYHIN